MNAWMNEWESEQTILFRLGRKSGIAIGLDRSRGDRTWDYETMYGQ